MLIPILCALLLCAGASLAQPANPIQRTRFSGKTLGSIFNNDINNIIWTLKGTKDAVSDYRRAVDAILDMKPGVLAQNVGMPDPVIYRSNVATQYDKYLVEVCGKVWSPDIIPEDAGVQVEALRQIRAAGTDPLTVTIEECRKRGVAIVASYRMNAEDYYSGELDMSDFDRAHKNLAIPGANCLDPAHPEVFNHRMAIFREVAQDFDIDGIEFDFRRWYHMVSDPLKNHIVLTRMVRETRSMLDEVAKAKHRKRLILGVRVGPSLDSEPNAFLFPGIYYDSKPVNASCKELGLDVTTWIKEGLVDYVCPSLFLPSLPGLPLTSEFAALAKGTKVGIYPTVFPLASWMHGVCERTVSLDDRDRKALALYKHDLCATVLEAYEDGADGISTFNWYSHLRDAKCPRVFEGDASSGAGPDAVQSHVYPLLRDRRAIEKYMRQPWAVPQRK